MPLSGALQLKDYPTAMVRLACARCDRKGQYRLENLIAKHGAETTLPDLRRRIAKCERDGKLGTARGVYYVDLMPKDWKAGSRIMTGCSVFITRTDHGG
jgi:hypothetical protein